MVLEASDCQGIFKQRLDAARLQQLRQNAGMAEFAWPTFLRLLAQALQGQEGCSARVQGSAPTLRLELRFQLQSAVLLASLELTATAQMPQLPEALPFLQALERIRESYATSYQIYNI